MSIYVLAFTVMVFLACGTYLILRQHAVKLILGLGLLSHAFNLIIFGTTRLTGGAEPILDKDLLGQPHYPDPAAFADPLPHALILTAIVISFGLTAYVIALVQRLHEVETDPVSGRMTEGRSAYLSVEHFAPGQNDDADDYQWLEYDEQILPRSARTSRPVS